MEWQKVLAAHIKDKRFASRISKVCPKMLEIKQPKKMSGLISEEELYRRENSNR